MYTVTVWHMSMIRVLYSMCLKKPVMGEMLHEGLICEKNCLSINIDVFNNSPTNIKKYN